MITKQSNFLIKLSVLCLLFPLTAACQTGASPKPSPTPNVNRTISETERDKTVQPANKNAAAVETSMFSGAVVTKNDVAPKGTRVEDFSPAGWHLMLKADGDLNGDKIPDAAAVFSRARAFDGKDESTRASEQAEEIVNTERVLIIALGGADGALSLDALTQKIILCRTCGAQMDDTLLGLKIVNQAIVIEQGALGTSSSDYTHQIKKDARRGWVVFTGAGKYRARATGKSSAARQKGIIALAEFDITREAEKLDRQANP